MPPWRTELNFNHSPRQRFCGGDDVATQSRAAEEEKNRANRPSAIGRAVVTTLLHVACLRAATVWRKQRGLVGHTQMGCENPFPAVPWLARERQAAALEASATRSQSLNGPCGSFLTPARRDGGVRRSVTFCGAVFSSRCEPSAGEEDAASAMGMWG
ncbi:unnamed protein product [Lampetra fluviatilis]